VNISNTIDKAARIFGNAKDALATNDRVNLISDQRQQSRSVLTAGWRIDDGIHQSAAAVAQRGVSGREQERVFANEALRGEVSSACRGPNQASHGEVKLGSYPVGPCAAELHGDTP
jgi:hypothetical protein